MIDHTHHPAMTRQAALLGLSRASVYCTPCAVPATDLAVMRRIDAPHLELPFTGSRMLRDLLRGEGFVIWRADQIQISMDGRGSWRDNVFVERLSRSVKSEEVYLRAYETGSEVRAGPERYSVAPPMSCILRGDRSRRSPHPAERYISRPPRLS